MLAGIYHAAARLNDEIEFRTEVCVEFAVVARRDVLDARVLALVKLSPASNWSRQLSEARMALAACQASWLRQGHSVVLKPAQARSAKEETHRISWKSLSPAVMGRPL